MRRGVGVSSQIQQWGQYKQLGRCYRAASKSKVVWVVKTEFNRIIWKSLGKMTLEALVLTLQAHNVCIYIYVCVCVLVDLFLLNGTDIV